MKYLKQFETQTEFEAFMNDPETEISLPFIYHIKENDNLHYHDLLPNVDTTNYATTFVNGETYVKEGLLFKSIVENFIQKYSPDETFDDNTWIDLDLEKATIESFRYDKEKSQIYSIADEPLYINYLSKITNFLGVDPEMEDVTKPYGILSFSIDDVSRLQVYVGGINKSYTFTLYYDGRFEEEIK